ncbi:MAG: MFS transporter [Mobilicoccus sp.]|nr:MFS transporter [Mobilicoccus sp.]
MSGPTPAPSSPRASVWRAPGMPALVGLTFFGFAGYAVLLPLVPLWVVRGGAGPAGAGLVNGVMLAATVAAQSGVPAALRRFGWGPVMAVGVVLLGLPSLAHLFSDALAWVLVLAAVRGVGFAVLTVTGAAAAAHLVDPSRRGAAIGTYGLAVALPNLTFLPFGPIIAEHVGWPIVFAIGALPVLAVPVALRLARHLPDERATTSEHVVDVGPVSGEAAAGPSLVRALLPSAVLLLAVTLAGGALITFAPQLVADPFSATAALVGMGLAAAVSRWLVGGLADRLGPGRYVWPASVLTVLCLVGFALTLGIPTWSLIDGPGWIALWVILATLLGVAYGALQNLTYVLTLDAAGPRRISTASAVWNIGFDAGTALGSVLVGAIAAGAGFGWAFLVAAGACALTLPLALRARHS